MRSQAVTGQIVQVNKRTFLKILTAFGVFTATRWSMFKTSPPIPLDDDFLIVNGWVMLKSDLKD
jgi:hypothetical protein